MRVSLIGAPLSAERKQRLSSKLIDAFADVEVGRNAPEIRSGFLVIFENVEPEDVWMGDRRMADASEATRAAVVSAHVMSGPWNDAMKADLFGRIEKALREEYEMPRPPGGADFWMTFVEVSEGGWGVGGEPVSIGRLAPVFSEDRQQRIRSYLHNRGADPAG
jgi:phenylpyruvate tautomerase PptA (4-oxalocrotonate tautomerase family)